MTTTLPPQIEIRPTDGFDVRLRLPGSKSLTNRALLLAALADDHSTLTGVLFSDDSQRMLDALRELGFTLRIDKARATVTVQGQAGRIPAPAAELHLGNAGTAMRSLAAACCLGDGQYQLDGIERMRERPIGELVDPLRKLGASIDYLGTIGYPPLHVHGKGLRGGTVDIGATLSSQYITALLMIAPYMQQGLTMRFTDTVTSRPYVEMTLELMSRFGITPLVDPAFTEISVPVGRYRATDYAIEPDASNASYFLAAAAIVPGSRCTIEGLGEDSLQGDAGFAEVLEEMGARVERTENTITVASPARDDLRGIDIDLNHMPDTAQTLAAVALFARGETVIRNVGNLRVKETDRMAAVQKELTKLGATVLIHGENLRIEPPVGNVVRPAAIDTYDDHRMAMSFAIIGLAARGVVINDPGCVAKTFPDFFDYLGKLRTTAGAAG